MRYLKEIKFHMEGKEVVLYVTDEAVTAEKLKQQGEAVLIYLHPGNEGENFSSFLFAVEDPDNLEPEYVERVYRRLKGLPWHILDTARCCVRETIPEDVEDFYQIYSHPSITKYMEGLYPEVEQEKQYVREYIEKVYTFYGYGVWTIVERESGAVIGRAGFSFREGYVNPELGFVIGVPWQRKGYAWEVCRNILYYGWTALEFDEVWAFVDPGNFPSLKLCERLGFRDRGKVILQGQEYCQLLFSNKLYPIICS